MNISLAPNHEKFIQSQLKNGRYPSADEIIAAALELLEESIYLEDSTNARHYEKWVEETRKKIAIATEQLKRGEGIDGEIVIARLREKIRKAKEARS